MIPLPRPGSSRRHRVARQCRPIGRHRTTSGRRHEMVSYPIGVWQIISPRVVGQRPAGVLWTNVVMGAIVTVLGLAAAGLLVTTAVGERRPHAAAADH
ncbi:SPW repeat protein [Nocardia africana]